MADGETGRGHQDSRLRPGEVHGDRRFAVATNVDGTDCGHRLLLVARAGPGAAGGRAIGRVFVRRRSVRDAHRGKTVRSRIARGNAFGDSARYAGPGAQAPSGNAARYRPDCRTMPGKGSREALRIGRRASACAIRLPGPTGYSPAPRLAVSPPGGGAGSRPGAAFVVAHGIGVLGNAAVARPPRTPDHRS